MDKITRIHIAKVPYEIGIDGEKELKKYLDEIRHELDPDLADEIMADIEVRITEILAERKVNRDDVITLKDIQAVQEQLGSPEQFTDADSKTKSNVDSKEPRQLFRDPDNAYLAGVASGIATYFSIDPIFIRLLFVALTFASGIGILIYIIMWILVPSAKTSSDKLLMRGEAVTAASLQRYRASAQKTIANLRVRSFIGVILKAVKIAVTVIVTFIILGLLTGIGYSIAALFTEPLHSLYRGYHLNWLLVGLLWLSLAALVSLLVLLIIRLWSQRSVKIAFFSVVGLFVLSLAGMAIVTPFVANHYNYVYGNNKLNVAIPVHNDQNAPTPTSLNLQADSNLIMSYDVSSAPLHAQYQSYPGMGQPQISIVNKGGTITVQTGQLSNVVPNCLSGWCKHIYLPIHMTLYGPALQNYTASGGSEMDLDSLTMNNMSLTSQNNSLLLIDNSYSTNMMLTATTGGAIDASDASAHTTTINTQDGTSVSAPATDTLAATIPEGCAQPILTLNQSPTTVTINGQIMTNQQLDSDNCIIYSDPQSFSYPGSRQNEDVRAVPSATAIPIPN